MGRTVELDSDEEIVALVRPATSFLIWITLKTVFFSFFVVVISIPMLQSGIIMLVLYAFLVFIAMSKLIRLFNTFKGQMFLVTTKRVVDTYTRGFRLQAIDLMIDDIEDVKTKRHEDLPLSLLKLYKLKVCGSAESGFDIIIKGQDRAEDIASLIKELANLR